MASSGSLLFILFLLSLGSAFLPLSLGHETSSEEDRRGREEGMGVLGGRRVLLSFRETPSGGNVSFECSPSGPCIACLYSEKNDEKYRCSETGYRIPFKCVEIGAGSKETTGKETKNSRSALEKTYAGGQPHPHVLLLDAKSLSTSTHRSLFGDSSTLEDGSQVYITYRSCIPAANEEKLSVLGFEGIMLCLLLMSGSVVYFRRKQNGALSGGGAMRLPTNSRF